MISSMLEKLLIEQGSSTLANIKPSNLFMYLTDEKCLVDLEVALYQQRLLQKGIRLSILRKIDNRALLFLYRKNQCQVILNDPGVRYFFYSRGYSSLEFDDVLSLLSEKLNRSDEFPHEIGCLLGYPLDDVKAFIEHKGKNCKAIGCWKVYFNDQVAKQLFERYARCKKVYTQLYLAGQTIEQLCV